MTDAINLRVARKRAKRQEEQARAQVNHFVHGRPKYLRQVEAAKRAKNDRDVELHLITKTKKGDA
jgi:Domain of unknown function (DUF4169)